MKKQTTRFIALISIFFMFSLSACDLAANALQHIADQISPKSTESFSQAEEISTIVAAQVTQLSLSHTLANPTLTRSLPSTPVPTEIPATETPTEVVSTIKPTSPSEGIVFSNKGISFTIPKGLPPRVHMEELDETKSFVCGMNKKKGAAFTFVQLLPKDNNNPDFLAFMHIISHKSLYEICDSWDVETLDALKVLLNTGDYSAYGALAPLPFPPIYNAMQLYHSKEKMLTFQNGSGIRFLTEFHQDAAVPSTSGLRYVFGGMTEDENYIIAAVIYMRKSPLPDEPEYPENMAGFFSQSEQMNTDAVNLLNETLDDAFDPNLTILDQLIESLEIGTP